MFYIEIDDAVYECENTGKLHVDKSGKAAIEVLLSNGKSVYFLNVNLDEQLLKEIGFDNKDMDYKLESINAGGHYKLKKAWELGVSSGSLIGVA